VNIEDDIVESFIRSVERSGKGPTVVVLRGGVPDIFSSAAATAAARMTAGGIAVVGFVLMGLIFMVVLALIVPIAVYKHARDLRRYAEAENRIRRALGLQEVPVKVPSALGILVSLLTVNLYLPFYAGRFKNAIEAHMISH
jgi:hypothetical protein